MEKISTSDDDSQAAQDLPPASQGDWVEKMVEVLIAKRAENVLPNPTRSPMFVLPRVNSDSTVVMTAEKDEDSAVESNSKRLDSNHQNVRVPKRSMRSIKGSYPRRPMVIAPIVKVPPVLPTEECRETKTHIEKSIEDIKPLRLPGRQRVRDSIYKAVVRSRPAKRHERQDPIIQESKTCPELTKFEGEFDLVMYSPIKPPSPNHQNVQHFSKPERYIGPKPPPRSPIKIFSIAEMNDMTSSSAEHAHNDKFLRPKLQYTKHKRNINASLYPLPTIPEAGLTEPRMSCSEVIRSEGRTSFSSLMAFKTKPCNRQRLESQLRIAEEHQSRIEEQDKSKSGLNMLRKSIANLPKLIPDSMMINRFSEDGDWLSLNDAEEGTFTRAFRPERREWLIGFMKIMLILGLLIPIIVLVIVFHKKHNIVLGINST